MRKWSIIFGLIIFVCVVTVSFSHTVDLYERVGFKQWEAILITVAVEATFLLSGWSILWHRYRGQKPGGPAYAGFLYGVVLVLFSNSSYTVGLDVLFANKVAQWVLALSVVFGVLIAEAIISRNLVHLREQEQTANRTNEQTAERTKESNETPERTTEQTVIDRTETPNKHVAEGRNGSPNKQANVQKTEQTNDKPNTSSRPNKRGDERTSQTDNSNITDVAVRYYNEHGKLPTVRTLASMAGCSNYRAYTVINELKEKKIAG